MSIQTVLPENRSAPRRGHVGLARTAGLLLILASSHAALSPAATLVDREWVAQYVAEGAARWTSDPGGQALAVDPQGNVYVARTSLAADGFNDFVTIKYDPQGNALWIARYDGPRGEEDYVRGLALDAAGNVYVSGSSASVYSGYDYATLKYSNDGVQQWVARYNGPGDGPDEVAALGVDAAGNVYVTGSSTGDAGFSEYATVKYDTDGNELWVARYGSGSTQDGAGDLALDAAGNVYVTGWSADANGDPAYATLKYNPDGQLLWEARYTPVGGFSDFPRRAVVAVGADGGVHIAGDSAGPNRLGNYLTIKYDADGNELWTAVYDGGPRNDLFSDMGVDGSGNVYVTGNSDNTPVTVKYDANGNRVWVRKLMATSGSGGLVEALAIDAQGNVYLGGLSSLSGGAQGALAVKYDSAGTLEWRTQYQTPAGYQTWAKTIAVDAEGAVYLSGITEVSLRHGKMRRDITTLKLVQTTPVPPVVDIKANDSDGPLTLALGTDLSANLSLEPNGYAGRRADTALCLYDGYRWSSWVRGRWLPGVLLMGSGPLDAVSVTRAVGILPQGAYTLVYAVDDNADGYLDLTWSDRVEVRVE